MRTDATWNKNKTLSNDIKSSMDKRGPLEQVFLDMRSMRAITQFACDMRHLSCMQPQLNKRKQIKSILMHMLLFTSENKFESYESELEVEGASLDQ